MTKFCLSRIIDVKEKLIEDKERELEEAINTIDDITMALDATEKDVEKTYNELAIPSLSGGDFSVLKDYLSYLNDRKHRLIDEKDLTQQRIEQLRINLINLMKELKMLEILRSKAAKVVKRTENRRIQKNVEHMALRIGERRI